MTGANPNPALMRISDSTQTIPNPAEDVRGRKVIDAQGEKLGKVTDLLIDDTANHVRFLLVEHGGILGMGATQSFIPVETITEYTDDDVYVNTDRQTVAGAPAYDPEIAADSTFYENTYGYYGYAPFWAGGAPPQDPWYTGTRRM